MKKKKDNDQSENMDEQASNYEEMLDGFSSGDEVEGDDGMALSDLLGESDSLELEGESKESTETDELISYTHITLVKDIMSVYYVFKKITCSIS